MKNYQLIFFLSPNLEEKEANRYLEKIRSDIKNLEGEIKETKKIEKRVPAYPIKKYEEVLMGIINFRLSPKKLVDFQNKLNLEKNIIRSMVTTLSPIKEVKPLRQRRTSAFGTKFGETGPSYGNRGKPTSFLKESKKTTLLKKPKLEKKKKVELKEIDKKLEEILNE